MNFNLFSGRSPPHANGWALPNVYQAALCGISLGELCWNDFGNNGSQINVSIVAYFRTHFEILTYIYYTVRRVVYTRTSHVISTALFPGCCIQYSMGQKAGQETGDECIVIETTNLCNWFQWLISN